MKKGQVYEGIIESVEFPNKGGIYLPEEDRWVVVKNGVPGQKVRFSVNKIRKGKAEGRLLEVLEPSASEIPSACPHFGQCGGCTYQNLPYEEQLAMKNEQVKKMMDEAVDGEYIWEGIKPSPVRTEYRNKMEFSFGDEYKDGPLALGMHKRGSFHDIVNVTDCQIVDEDSGMYTGMCGRIGTSILSPHASCRIFPPPAGKKSSKDRRDPGGSGHSIRYGRTRS